MRKIIDNNLPLAFLLSIKTLQDQGIGNHKMAQTSDASYSILEDIYQQYLRLSNLRNSSALVSNAATDLDIFSHYAFDDLNDLFGRLFT